MQTCAKADAGMFSRKEPWGGTNNVRPERRSPRFSEAAIWVSETQVSDYELALGR